MKLTQEGAEANVGKYIDCYKRMLGNYPYQIIREKHGVLLLKDSVGVCTPIPEKSTDFNCQDFDYMFEMVEVSE